MTTDQPGWRGKADIVYGRLRNDIESGLFEPGRELPESELVEYTGASRTPVREAIRRLAADGLVDLQPRRAPRVSLISLKSARALSDFRVLLESQAISLVTELARTDATVQKDFRELLGRFEQLNAEGTITPDGPFRTSAEEFDALLAAHTPNEYLRRAILDLRPHTARLRAFAHNDVTRLQQAVAEHIAMCQAVLDGDPVAAQRAIVEHLRHVEDAIFRHLFSQSSGLLVS